LVEIATKGIRWMPWQQEATKDAGACEKPRGAGKHAMIRGCPNGETRRPSWAVTSFGWGQRGELKHLSTRRKGNQKETPQVAASERGRAQTVPGFWGGVVGPAQRYTEG